MKIRHFQFNDQEKQATIAQKMKLIYPDIAIISNPNSMQITVETTNSNIFDARIAAVIKDAGGKPID